MFDDVVPEDNSQKENRKDKFQLLKDIFDHTDKRIFLNQQKLVDLQNSNLKKKLTEHDSDVRRITDLDISFPQDYYPNTIAHQQRLVDQAIAEFREREEEELERKSRVKLNTKDLTAGELAKILAKPNKLGALNNSYLTFKKLGQIHRPEFLKLKQKKSDRMDRKLKIVAMKI